MDYSIFAMQVTRPLRSPRDPIYERLHGFITSEPARTTPGHRYRFYRKVCNELLGVAREFDQGVWDYWDVPSRAPGDFQDWVDGLQGKEARTAPAEENGEPRYMVFTLALLLQHGSTSDTRLMAHANIPEDRLWRRDTFEHLLKGISLLNFLNVQSEVVYLLPGDNAALGLTAADLDTEDYHYLRKLT
jgi:hypothetical protein